jgi:ssRNA-specific RNase YbeY (16S rRNA maturation enzyme)
MSKPQDTDCVIEYNDYQWNDHEAEIELWKLFCGIVVHEYSHLMGYADTTSAQDPGSITNGVITSANWNIPQCRNRPKGAQ